MLMRCIMTYKCLQSFVMSGNTFKHNWNDFFQREQYISEHSYFSIFTMIALLLMVMAAGHIQNICCVCMNNNQTNLFEKVYHFTFWLQQTSIIPSSHCSTSIFEEEFKFQYTKRDGHIHIATQNIILTFLRKWHFAWESKYGSLS